MNLPDYSKYQYESIFTLTKEIPSGKRTKKIKQVVVRLFDPKTKESFFRDVTDYSIPDIFISDNKSPNSPYKSYLDKKIPLTKKSFESLDEFNKFVKNIKIKTGEIKTIEYDGEEIEIEETIFEDDAFGYLDLGHTFLQRAFPDSESSFHTHRIWMLDIETRSNYAVQHFPHADMAPEEITMIQIYDNFTNQYIVLGRKNFTGKFEKDNVKFIKIEDERDLLEFFIKLLEKHNPSIISGFNCIPLDSNIWTDNKIKKLTDIKYKDRLSEDRVYVENIFPISKKKSFDIILDNGMKVSSSKDHIFKTYRVPKGKYFTPYNSGELIEEDMTVENISNSLDNHYIYLEHKIHNNTNRDVTYRQLLIENLDILHKKGIFIYTRDTQIVRKLSKYYEGEIYQKKMDFFSSKHILEKLGKNEVIKFIERSKSIKIFNNGYNGDKRPTTSILERLDDVISEDILYLAGLWYTDGTSSYKSEASITNTNIKVVENLKDKYKFKYKKFESEDHKDSYIFKFAFLSNARFLIAKALIYDHINAKSKKCIDIYLLSQLSKKQFLYFYSGLVDGDGSIDGTFCNFNNDISNVSELLRWNGSFVLENNTYLRPFMDSESLDILKDSIKIKERFTNIKRLEKLEKKSKQFNTTYFITDKCSFFIRIKDIKEGDSVLMRDIETSNHYFEYQGIYTHNCKTFDFPYLTNRIARVLDGFNGNYKEELNKRNSYIDMPNVNRLSPLGVVNGKDTHTLDGMDGVEVFWRGRLLLDYRELALKYGFLGLPSYSLKNVANHFGLSQKIDNSSYKNFDGSYTGDGYIFPLEEPQIGEDPIFDAQKRYRDDPTPENKKMLEQVVYDRFVDYSLRDVEILVELDDLTKYLDSHLQIAYFCGVSPDDNWGTQKHWVALMFKESMKKNLVLPLKQQYSEEDVQFLAGWVRTVPGKYDFVSSFDFTSLYPSLIRAFNIGGDTLVKDYELHPDLKEIRKKYFNYFIKEKLNRTEYPDKVEKDGIVIEEGRYLPLGEIVKKHNGEINDLVEEREYYTNLLENSEEISKVLKKHNVCVTANGYFYRIDEQSMFSSQMERFFLERVKEKREAQRLEGVLEDIKKEIKRRGLEDI